MRGHLAPRPTGCMCIPRVTTRETVPPSSPTPTASPSSRARPVPFPSLGVYPSMASSIAMRACPAPCHATRAGRHAGASRRPTSSASSVSVVARAVNAGETSGKATEDGKPVPPALTSEVRVHATEAVTRCARVDDASVRGRRGGSCAIALARAAGARASRSIVRSIRARFALDRDPIYPRGLTRRRTRRESIDGCRLRPVPGPARGG